MTVQASQDPNDTYTKLIELLDQHGAQYRLIDHPEEGRCEIVSPMRGHDVSKAAKCMILMVKIGKKSKVFVLAVVPGNAGRRERRERAVRWDLRYARASRHG